MLNYIWLKWIDYSPYFDGANVSGAELGEPDANGFITEDWGLQELSYYDAVITDGGIRLPFTYLVSFGDVYPLTDANRDVLLKRVENDADAVWFIMNEQEWVFIPDPEGEYAYYLIEKE